MDKILFYQYCEEALEILLCNHKLNIDDCKAISKEYANAVYVEMQKAGIGFDAAKYGELTVHLKTAQEKYDSRYYENCIDELKKEKHEEELRERELAINESAANASQRSAKASEQSAKYAKEANKISIESNSIAKKSSSRANKALVISIISAVAAVVSAIAAIISALL